MSCSRRRYSGSVYPIMQSVQVICVLFMFAVLNAFAQLQLQDPPLSCWGIDEEYTDCGPACPPSCNPLPPNFYCVTLCVPGCFCKEGYLRNRWGVCVAPEDCKPRRP